MGLPKKPRRIRWFLLIMNIALSVELLMTNFSGSSPYALLLVVLYSVRFDALTVTKTISPCSNTDLRTKLFRLWTRFGQKCNFGVRSSEVKLGSDWCVG